MWIFHRNNRLSVREVDKRRYTFSTGYFSDIVERKDLIGCCFQFRQFSCSVMSDSLRPHGLQHARPPCPSPTHGVYSNLCLLSRWCHPTISSSIVPFSSCLQSFPASGSFLMSQFFASGGQSIGASGCCFNKLYFICFYLTFPPYLTKLIALSNFLLST